MGNARPSTQDQTRLQIFSQVLTFVTQSDSISSTAEVNLSSPGTVTVTFPAGASLVNAVVIANLKANNQTANQHDIGVTLQRNYAGGGWTDIVDLTVNSPMSLWASAGSTDSLTLVEDITSIITASGNTITFRWQVDSDNAGEVHYTSVFTLRVEYDFSST